LVIDFLKIYYLIKIIELSNNNNNNKMIKKPKSKEQFVRQALRFEAIK